METGVVATNNNQQVVPLNQAWGSEGVHQSDILLPKVLLMQGLSKYVVEEKAQMGDLVNSVTGEKLGDKDHPVEFIPIMTSKSWVQTLKGTNKYLRSVPITPENINWPLETLASKELATELGIAQGDTIVNSRSLDFCVLLTKEINEEFGLPYLISFRRTSYRAGRKLATHFSLCMMQGIPPASYTFKLYCGKEMKDKQPYYVFDVIKGRKTEQKELQHAFNWYQTLKKGQYSVHDAERGEIEPEDSLETAAF